ncbi:MAG: diheme cytochrome c [Rhodocyclales bacterium]|nr:diheme cytochrome c [Rhodocyclales bacterium]
MTKSLFPILAAALLLSPSAHADSLPMPYDAPPSYKAECGSCHMAFQPGLLLAGDWRLVMAQLDKHYGDNAALDEKTRREIEDFLVRNAGTRSRYAGAGDPPRLTGTDRFRRKHDKLSAAVWRDQRVGTAANCVACHPGAEQGRYSERDLTVPGYAGHRGEHGHERRRHGHDDD